MSESLLSMCAAMSMTHKWSNDLVSVIDISAVNVAVAPINTMCSLIDYNIGVINEIHLALKPITALNQNIHE